MKPVPLLLCSAALLGAALACSDDSDAPSTDASGGTGGIAAGGEGGSSASGRMPGGASTGAESSGGDGSGGGEPVDKRALACSPGEFFEDFNSQPEVGGPYRLCNLRGTISDSLPDDAFVNAMTLPTAMTAGEKYSLSVEVRGTSSDGPGLYEIWGSRSECGEPVERLHTGPLREAGVVCIEVKPSESFEHLLVVADPDGNGGFRLQGDLGLCPNGSCPAP